LHRLLARCANRPGGHDADLGYECFGEVMGCSPGGLLHLGLS
jgi:hypothetical protein